MALTGTQMLFGNANQSIDYVVASNTAQQDAIDNAKSAIQTSGANVQYTLLDDAPQTAISEHKCKPNHISACGRTRPAGQGLPAVTADMVIPDDWQQHPTGAVCVHWFHQTISMDESVCWVCVFLLSVCIVHIVQRTDHKRVVFGGRV